MGLLSDLLVNRRAGSFRLALRFAGESESCSSFIICSLPGGNLPEGGRGGVGAQTQAFSPEAIYRRETQSSRMHFTGCKHGPGSCPQRHSTGCGHQTHAQSPEAMYPRETQSPRRPPAGGTDPGTVPSLPEGEPSHLWRHSTGGICDGLVCDVHDHIRGGFVAADVPCLESLGLHSHFGFSVAPQHRWPVVHTSVCHG